MQRPEGSSYLNKQEMADQELTGPGEPVAAGPATGRVGSPYSMRDFIRLLFKRRRVILWFTVGLFAVACVGLFLSDPGYKAMVGILANEDRVEEQIIAANGTETAATDEVERTLMALGFERDALIQLYSARHWQIRNLDQQIRLAEKRLGESRDMAEQEGARPVEANEVRSAQRVFELAGLRRWFELMLALVLAIIGGIGVALVVERRDHTITTGQELERYLDLPHLASIPDQQAGEL